MRRIQFRRNALRNSVFFCFLLGVCGLFSQGTPTNEGVQQSLDFVVYCKDHFAVAARQSGLAGVDLKTGHVAWSALSDKIVDEGPVAAGNSVAVIADNHHAIYAVSKSTGRLLWHQDHASNRLASDGRYFYLPEYDTGKIAALNSRTGSTVWTLDMPEDWTGYFDIFQVHGASLYTDRAVVDLRNHNFVHEWARGMEVTAIAFSNSGDILLGDSEGNITIYGPAFNVRNKLHAGDAQVDAIGTSEGEILVSLAAAASERRGRIESLRWDGGRRWDMPGLPTEYAGFNPFIVVGRNALIVQPGTSEQKWRFESRNLETGKVNWEAPEGDYFNGWPVVCGSTVFLRDGDRIAGFNVSDGAPY